jgi:squalene-hopene/tetraprenyl-beta-curcumene cyclase
MIVSVASILLALAQEDAPIRASVERSLAFLEKEGVAWMRQRDCLSCHHVPFLIWSHRAAQAKGIPLDAPKLGAWTEWSRQESMKRREKVRLSPQGLQALREGGIPSETTEKLAAFSQKFGGDKEEIYLRELAKLLTPDELARNRSALLEHATRDKGDGGGLDSMVQLLLAGVYGDGELDFVSSTRTRILELQQADGSWKPGGQLLSMNRSAAEATRVTTTWAVLALADAVDAPSKEGVARARTFLRNASPGKVLEALAARLLLERRFGEDAFASTLQDLLGRQNPDGGWASLHGAASDAFATGQVLYALSATAATAADEAIRRGRRFLIETQGPEGSLPLAPLALTSPKRAPERLKNVEPIYRYWGSAWAAIGLAATLPSKP